MNLPKKYRISKIIKKRKGIILGGMLVLALLFTGILAPWLAPYDPYRQDLNNTLAPPDQNHPFGTDNFGRDILSRVIYGARVSLLEIFVSVSLSLIIGVPLGLIAGFFGGRVDQLIMWCLDIIFAFPGILLAILIVSVLGPSLFNMLIAIAIFSVPVYGRLTRNLTLTIKELEYVGAAKALGATNKRIIFRHILKNAFAPLLVQASLTAGGVILSASSLSFLGLGVQPPIAEWGAMISNGRSFIGIAPHLSFFPGIAIAIVVLSFNMLGDGLRDLLDPKLKNNI